MLRRNLVGIDLGTSYSSVTWLDRRGFPKCVPNAEGRLTTPSLVYCDGRKVYVGERAEQAELESAECVLRHAKRDIGEPNASWDVGGIEYTPVEVSAFILRKLKKDTEARIGPIDKAVITVPAHFSSHQRTLTIEAARMAGLDVLDLVNEPVAAALAYIIGESEVGDAFRELAVEQTVLVYDLGGGTFDLSLVQYMKNDVRVISASGDLRLGGLDFNERVIDYVADLCLADRGVDPRFDVHSFVELARSVENAKRALTEANRPAQVFCHCGGEPYSAVITRIKFESLTADLLDRTRDLIESLIEHSGLGWHGVHSVLPVGGASRMPMVRKMIHSLVEQMRVKAIDPDLAISQGAALYAGILASRTEGLLGREAQQRFDQIETGDMSTRELGLIVVDKDGRRTIVSLIGRNTPLPASASVTVGTVRPNQSRISLKVVERDSSSRRRHTVCRCVVDRLPPDLPAGSVFDVELTYTPSGLLQVIARHRESRRLSTVNVVYTGSEVDNPAEGAALTEQAE